jgi:hypothetical protein
MLILFDLAIKKTYFILLSVAQLAKFDVNMNGSILSNYELHLNALDGQCTADVVMKRFIEIITNWDYKSVVGILGKKDG